MLAPFLTDRRRIEETFLTEPGFIQEGFRPSLSDPRSQ
jgi:hypothetical protein